MAIVVQTWGWIAAACLGAIAALELVIRGLSRRIADLLEWRDWECQHKANAIGKLAREGGASVVAIGASDMNATFDPHLFSDVFAGRRPACNAALNGASPRTLELWMRDVVLPALRPDLVILGTHVAEMNDRNDVGERGLQLFRRSLGWRRLHPERTTGQRILFWLERRSFLVRYRHFFREPGRWGIKQYRPPTWRRRLRRRWRALRYSVRKDRGSSFAVTPLGLMLGLSRFHGVPYQLGTPRMVRSWAEIVTDYEVGGRELSALGRLVDLIRAGGADVVLVLMPVMPDWVDLQPGGRRDLEAYKHALDRFAVERDVYCLDLMSGFASTNEYADARHANEVGQARFTRALAEVTADRLRTAVRSNDQS